MMKFLKTPQLTRRRIWLAVAVAVVADGLQWMLGPLGWLLFDEIIDVIAMVLTSLLLGFHWMLLPTFILECVPLVDLLPTWTGCVAVLIAMRKKSQAIELSRSKLLTASENSNLSEK